MRPISILTVSMLVATFGLQDANASVKIFFGYLDEEVNGVVTSLFLSRPDQTVVAIGQGITKENVFGMTYKPAPQVASMSAPVTVSDNHSDGSLGSGLSGGTSEGGHPRPPGFGGGFGGTFGGFVGAFQAAPPVEKSPVSRVIDAMKNELSTNAASYDKLSSQGIYFDRYNVNLGAAILTRNGTNDPLAKSDDIVVVARPPVNGRNPGMLRAYVDMIVNAVGALPQAAPEKGGVEISSFGTAGGVSQTAKPNDVIHVKSSLFVGVMPAPKEKGWFGSKQYLATIQYASLGDDKAPIVLYQQAFHSPEDAQAAAKEAFNEWNGRDKRAVHVYNPCGSKAVTIESDWMKSTVAGVLKSQLIGKRDTSLTTSFFADPQMKATAEKLGLTNVNMEDFHMIAAVNALKTNPPKFVSIDRVVSDPPVMPKNAVQAVRDWMLKGTYTRKQYEDALLWGLKGRSVWNPPASAKWRVFDSFPKGQAEKWVSQLPFKDGQAALDPFYYDLAGNFLRKLDNNSYSMLDDSIDPSLKKSLSNDGLDQLRSMISSASARAGSIARYLTHGPMIRSQDQEDDAKAAINDLMNTVSTITPKDGPLAQDLERLGMKSIPMLETSSDHMKIVAGLPWNQSVYDTFSSATDRSAYGVSRFSSMSDEDIYRMMYKISLINLTPAVTYNHTLSNFEKMEKAARSQ